MTDSSCWKNCVKLRRFTEQDLTFMEQLHAAGRATELAMAHHQTDMTTRVNRP
ncbi:hypothetical protein [Thalassolituus sp.]|jgi:hypothetical protein|uniref:hypothetical protein n=1 Tax=Thalassolituus sp. TaxID=2030822 RepID=UPI001B40FF9F|nr:hypothetical protein [Thalassolituus sp.]MBQ0779949.1 hypothetical protein [Thalassolituus oleivorans]